MGWGDELIAAGQAQAAQAADPQRRQVRILDRDHRVRWHLLWQGNLAIAVPNQGGSLISIVNGPGARPYVAAKTPERWTWKPFTCTPAKLHLGSAERKLAAAVRGGLLIEPTIKRKASPNKDWGWARWQSLVNLRPDWPWVQAGPPDAPILKGVRHLVTDSFLAGAAVLSGCYAAVLPEGGLHHAAAAVGVPAVVIYGGFIAPEHTGYALHRNLFTGGTACGMRTVCAHCTAAMAAITPERVIAELESLTLEPCA